MRRFIASATALALAAVTLALAATVTLCSPAMSREGHQSFMPLTHQVLLSCEAGDLLAWLVRLSSPLLGSLFTAFVVTLAAVGAAAAARPKEPPGANRFDKHCHQRSPYDFALELFAQGILHPRLPDHAGCVVACRA